MKAKRRKKRIVRYRTPLNLNNIGIWFFLTVFIFLGIHLFGFFNREKVSIYEVTEGKNEMQATFDATGIALRNEVLTGAPVTGTINFYVKEGTRVSMDTTLFSIDESGTVTQLLNETAQDNSILTDSNLDELRKTLMKYSSSYNDMAFEQVYDFQYTLNATLIECINLNSIDNINQTLAQQGNPAFMIQKAASTGVVAFYVDELEGVTVDTLTEDAFSKEKYKRKDIVAGTVVTKGEAIYKTINNESWDIVVPLTEKQQLQYANVSEVTIELLDEKIKTTGQFRMKQIGSSMYGVVTLNQNMMNYADERFIDVRIIGNYTRGLKIPKNALVEKSFYTIPTEFLHTGGDSNNQGFTRMNPDTGATDFIEPEIFLIKDGYCYVDKTEIPLNTRLVKLDSMTPHVVGISGNLEGVYNVNNGYTRFRYIEKLSEKNDYIIISATTKRGLSVHDQIVLNASLATDDTIVFR